MKEFTIELLRKLGFCNLVFMNLNGLCMELERAFNMKFSAKFMNESIVVTTAFTCSIILEYEQLPADSTYPARYRVTNIDIV